MSIPRYWQDLITDGKWSLVGDLETGYLTTSTATYPPSSTTELVIIADGLMTFDRNGYTNDRLILTDKDGNTVFNLNYNTASFNQQMYASLSPYSLYNQQASSNTYRSAQIRHIDEQLAPIHTEWKGERLIPSNWFLSLDDNIWMKKGASLSTDWIGYDVPSFSSVFEIKAREWVIARLVDCVDGDVFYIKNSTGDVVLEATSDGDEVHCELQIEQSPFTLEFVNGGTAKSRSVEFLHIGKDLIADESPITNIPASWGNLLKSGKWSLSGDTLVTDSSVSYPPSFSEYLHIEYDGLITITRPQGYTNDYIRIYDSSSNLILNMHSNSGVSGVKTVFLDTRYSPYKLEIINNSTNTHKKVQINFLSALMCYSFKGDLYSEAHLPDDVVFPASGKYKTNVDTLLTNEDDIDLYIRTPNCLIRGETRYAIQSDTSNVSEFHFSNDGTVTVTQGSYTNTGEVPDGVNTIGLIVKNGQALAVYSNMYVIAKSDPSIFISDHFITNKLEIGTGVDYIDYQEYYAVDYMYDCHKVDFYNASWSNKLSREESNPQPKVCFNSLVKTIKTHPVVSNNPLYKDIMVDNNGNLRGYGYFKGKTMVSDIPVGNKRVQCFEHNSGVLIKDTYSDNKGNYIFDNLMTNKKYKFVAFYGSADRLVPPNFNATAIDWQSPIPYKEAK